MKKNMNLMVLLALASVMSASLIACGDSTATGTTAAAVKTEESEKQAEQDTAVAADASGFAPITIKLANQTNTENNECKADYELAEKIKEATEGRVTIEVYPDSALGDYSSVFSEVMIGSIGMAHTTMMETYDSRMSASMLPYLGSTYEELRKAYSPDNYLYQQVYEAGQGIGLHVFGFFCEGYNGMGTTKELVSPADPEVDKGIILRVPMMDVYNLSAQDLGFRTSSMPFSDTYTAMQTGVVDGFAGGAPQTNYNSFRDVDKYFYDYHQCQEATCIYMNEELFKSLLPQDQETITKIIQQICDESVDKAKTSDNEYKKKLSDEGINVIEFTDEELGVMAEHVRSTTWPKLAETLGQDFLDNVKKSLE